MFFSESNEGYISLAKLLLEVENLEKIEYDQKNTCT